MAKRYVLKTLKLTDEQIDRGDVNRDGKLDLKDYQMIKRHVLQTYTIEQPEEIAVEGPSFEDCTLFFVSADGELVDINAEAVAKSDAAIPEGGYIIAVPTAEIPDDVAAALKSGIQFTLSNVDTEACASAAQNTELTDATCTFELD